MLDIEVAYAKPEQQWLIALQMPEQSIVQDAVEASGLLARCPEIEAHSLVVGIFGRACPLHQVLKAGDRVEIYRPLAHDPKEARRRRAGKKYRAGS